MMCLYIDLFDNHISRCSICLAASCNAAIENGINSVYVTPKYSLWSSPFEIVSTASSTTKGTDWAETPKLAYLPYVVFVHP